MRIESLTLQNFRSYDKADIDFSGISLASVVGPNGAGKSSILEALVFALTGGKGLRNIDAFIRAGEEECRVTLTFAMEAERYRITRTRSNRNAGKSTVEIVRQQEGLWVAETTGAHESEDRIEKILGVDHNTLLRTSIVSQGDADSFFALRPAQRLEALGSILKLDETFGPMEAHFKAEAEAHKTALGKVRSEIERLEIDVAAAAEREDLAEVARETLGNRRIAQEMAEQDLGEATDRARVAQDDVRDAEEAQRRLTELTAHRDDLAARRTTITTELARAKLRTDEKAALEAELSYRPDLEEGLANCRRAEEADHETRRQQASLDADLRAAKVRAQAISDQGKAEKYVLDKALTMMEAAAERITAIEKAETPLCDRCGQPIEDDALARTLDQLRYDCHEANQTVNDLKAKVEKLREDFAIEAKAVTAIEAQLAALPLLSHDLPEQKRLEERVAHLNEIPAKLAEIAAIEERSREAMVELRGVTEQLTDPARARELELAQAAVNAATERSQAAVQARIDAEICERAVVVARQEVSALDQTVARHEEAISLLGPSVEKLAQAKNDEKQLEQDQADADTLRKAFSKWGIPALIISNVLVALEREVNELLGLYEGGLTVRFESEKETRDGSRDSLEIMVERDGESRPFDTYSGGEKYRVASAMRLGLAVLLSHRSGSRVRSLILDEPEGLDEEGRQKLVKILEHLQSNFERILCMSHHEDLQEAFPSQILVTRGDDGLSQVEVRA